MKESQQGTNLRTHPVVLPSASRLGLKDAELGYRSARALCVLFSAMAFLTVPQVQCQSPAWTYFPNAGAAGEVGSMVFDQQRNALYLVTRTSGVADLQTWTRSAGVWTQIPVQGPGNRTGFSLTYDPVRRVTWLFGGVRSYLFSTWFGDTWKWDGVSWTSVAQTGPTPRAGHGAAFDPQRGVVLLFGGRTANGLAGDSWEWNGTSWTLLPVVGPGPRGDHVMATMTADSRVIMYGGEGPQSFLDETWQFHNGSWSQISTAYLGARVGHSVAYDAVANKLVLFGGNAFPAPNGIFRQNQRDTWQFDQNRWVRITTSGPPGRNGGAIAFDPSVGRTVLYGGGGGILHQDTWEWSPAPASTPTASTFGAGCGIPPLGLDQVAGSLPVLGSQAQARASNLPTSLSFLSIGWSRARFSIFNLPMDLAAFGLPGCQLLQSADLATALPMVSGSNATATFTLAMPSTYEFLGATLFLQAWGPAPGQNLGELVVSNGLQWTVGY